jgi:hypothetical protein
MKPIFKYLFCFLLVGCNTTENITKKGIHIDAMPIWITFGDTVLYKDNINVYIQFDSSTIKLIEK